MNQEQLYALSGERCRQIRRDYKRYARPLGVRRAAARLLRSGGEGLFRLGVALAGTETV